MSGQDVVGPAKLARVPFLGALLRVVFGDDAVAFTVTPALARAALDDELSLFVRLLADGTLTEGMARSAKGVILKPLGVESGIIGSAARANSAPKKGGRE